MDQQAADLRPGDPNDLLRAIGILSVTDKMIAELEAGLVLRAWLIALRHLDHLMIRSAEAQRRRISMVLLGESGMTQPAIAGAMGVWLSTVNRAHMAYDQGGIKALRPKPCGGRKRENMTIAAKKTTAPTTSSASPAIPRSMRWWRRRRRSNARRSPRRSRPAHPIELFIRGSLPRARQGRRSRTAGLQQRSHAASSRRDRHQSRTGRTRHSDSRPSRMAQREGTQDAGKISPLPTLRLRVCKSSDCRSDGRARDAPFAVGGDFTRPPLSSIGRQ
jgi:hypothetical protein